MTLTSAALLGVVLLGAPQAQPPAPDQRAEAERLARSGAHAEALKRFQALAAVNPDDIDARLWIARLHTQMGHPERAADVYQSIVAAQPQNVDALLGLGEALTLASRFREGGDALSRAEALAPDRPAILTAQGRLHRSAGRSTLALAYFERALALEPSNAEAQMALDALRAERAHRLDASYYFERFDVDPDPDADVPDTHAGTVEINLRAGDKVRVFGGFQHLRKFDRDEDRGGGGIEWFVRRDIRLRAGGLFGGGTEVLPDADTSVDLEFLRSRVAWLLGFRHLDFDSSSTFLWSPGLTLSLSDRLAVTFRYYHSESDFNDFRAITGNDGFSLKATGRVGRRVWLNGGYARGFEGLALITAERSTQFSADNLSGGIRFDATPFTSIGGAFEHQWREFDMRVATATINLIQRF
jgi:YaiO family outer membrane protein